MDWWQWLLWILLFSFYIVCLFTVCSLTFAKGYTVLGIIGIFIPFIWLICAILPAKENSRFAIAQIQAAQQQAARYTS